MSLIIKGMSLPKHADVNGEKDTAYKCLILAHAEGTPTDNCYFYCPNCGAKMDEQALKEREENAN